MPDFDPVKRPTYPEDTAPLEVGPVVDDPKVAKAQVAEKIKYTLQQHWTTLLNSEAGQVIIMYIINKCGIHYVKKIDDFNQGRRSIGLELVKEMTDIDRLAWAKMLIAHSDRAEEQSQENAAKVEAAKELQKLQKLQKPPSFAHRQTRLIK